ncbi:MAG: peptide deformylase [Sedimentisphaerales bacterium]|jgi:peptide deformylase
MTIDVENCHITHYPAQVLGKASRPVEKIDDNIRRLAAKMLDIMIEQKGIGLAAPQAGVPLRLFIISLDGSRNNVRAYVNPTVKPEGTLVENEEGCLSVPGIFTKIKRYSQATVTATGLDGKTFTEKGEGLYARALQHEFDHIEGVTIVNRMPTTARIAHRKQLKMLEEEHNDVGS